MQLGPEVDLLGGALDFLLVLCCSAPWANRQVDCLNHHHDAVDHNGPEEGLRTPLVRKRLCEL
jgi:hypothetical protein